MPSYEQFLKDVKASLKKGLACYEISDQELDDYLKSEENQVLGEYKDLLASDEENEGLSQDAIYKAAVSSIAYCLEMCY